MRSICVLTKTADSHCDSHDHATKRQAIEILLHGRAQEVGSHAILLAGDWRWTPHGVCQLAEWEFNQWRADRILPNCSEHKHIKKTDACDMTHTGNLESYPTHSQVAAWATDKTTFGDLPSWISGVRERIVLFTTWSWRLLEPSKYPRMVLAQQGHKPVSYRTKDLRTRIPVRVVEEIIDPFEGRAVMPSW